jgi:acyl-CoA dehydrogenase
VLASKAREIAASVARPAAGSVDRDARFPQEAFDALRAERLLGAAIPVRLGGLGARVTEVAEACAALGAACPSTATIFAMHQIQILTLVRHGAAAPAIEDLLRDAAHGQWLIASATSEDGTGGDLQRSVAALEHAGDRVTLSKRCPVLSYGAQADAILATARRNAGASASDQVAVVLRRDDYELEQLGVWDALGLRGTCSPPMLLTARSSAERVLEEPFRRIARRTMVPFSHVVWAASWSGIAAGAVEYARASVREHAMHAPDALPFTARTLDVTVQQLHVLRATVREAARQYERMLDDPRGDDQLSSLEYALKVNHLKVIASRLTVDVCERALEVCGIHGYARQGGAARHLRDALGAPVMIANTRLNEADAALVVATKDVLDDEPWG